LCINISSLICAIIDEVIVTFWVVIKAIEIVVSTIEVIDISNRVVSNDMIIVHHLVIWKHLVWLVSIVMNVTISVRTWLIVQYHWVLKWTRGWHSVAHAVGATWIWNYRLGRC